MMILLPDDAALRGRLFDLVMWIAAIAGGVVGFGVRDLFARIEGRAMRTRLEKARRALEQTRLLAVKAGVDSAQLPADEPS